jgi:tungstate transport system ATP-binding protein
VKLVLSHIKKEYGGKAVLTDCSVVFEGHSTYVLMGRNGCGKSTLLRICALLEKPDSGDMAFFSGASPLPQDLALRRRITLVLARTGVFNTSVFNNVAYGLNIRGVSHPEVERKVTQTLDFVGLAHKKNQRALTLSSGETQRLGIARALVVGPEILFLDEPTASVDQENTEIIESIIKTMRKDGTTTVILTTHDREQAERLADCLLVMQQGTLAETPP